MAFSPKIAVRSAARCLLAIGGLTWFLAFSPLADTHAQALSRSESPTEPDEAYCTIRGEALKFLPPSSRRMAGLLEKIAQTSDLRQNTFLNLARAKAFESEFLAVTNQNPAQRVNLLSRVAYEYLNAGESQTAIEYITQIEDFARAHGMSSTRFMAELRGLKALSYLRVGEQANCVTNHNTASCIFPILPAGVHQNTEGSLKAIQLLEEQMRAFPRDRRSAWLLNLAYMTIGGYPSNVPPAALIPPSTFQSEDDIGAFPDIAPLLGLDDEDYAGGTITEDFDNDGHLDIMISDWSLRGPLKFYRNKGDGSFEDRTVQAGLSGIVGGLSIVQGDYNNDGLLDVLVLRGAWLGAAGRHPDSLLRNDGDGHFTDVTEDAGLLAFHPNQTAVWFDYDSDGWLDLYFGYESFGDEVHPCKLFRNNRNGTFTECAAASGVAVIGFVKGVVAGDYNNDGRPDLYLSLRGQPNVLLRNDGPESAAPGSAWKFTDVSTTAGVTEPISSFPTMFVDFNNDGWEDIIVTGYAIRDIGDVAADYLGVPTPAERARAYRNRGNGTFEDVTQAMNLYKVIPAMGGNFGDLDNDGFPDLYFGTGDPSFATLSPNRAFRNAGGTRFLDITTSSATGHLQKGHGVSIADLDNDGDKDIFHSVGGAYEGDFYANSLFKNPGHSNQWITLKLEGIESNKAAIGAKIKVSLNTPQGQRLVCRTVNSGGSFGANPLRQEIGLGQASSIEKVEIHWPRTGKTQTVQNLQMNRFYRIREGEADALDLKLKPTPFKENPALARTSRHRHPTAATIPSVIP